MKDWRGTEIEVGSRVLTHSKNWNHSLGDVEKINPKTGSVTVALREHDICTRGKQKLVTYSDSLTVLTEDMFPELSERIHDLESDVEYYKYEASRTW